MKILGITTTYNISEKIPYVMPYYERMDIDKLIIYDNHSTDDTVEKLSKYPFVEIRYYETDSFNDWVILDIKNSAWKEYKNDYDWCIICDFDEVLYSERNFKEVLKEKRLEGKNYFKKIALNLLSRNFPPINGKLIHENVEKGFIWDCDDDIPGTWGNKVILFDIKNTDIEYTEIGAHNCKINGLNNHFDDEISFFHLKLIDFNYVINLSKIYHERIKKHQVNCYNNFVTDLENIYKKSERKSIPIDYYINTPGKIIYPPLLLLLESASNIEEGKEKVHKIIKHINKDVFYAIGVVTYNPTNIDYDYDELFEYGRKHGLSMFVGDSMNYSINEWMQGYKYLFENNNKFERPWVTMCNDKILKYLSDENLIKTLKENPLSESIIFNGIEIKRFNQFIKEEPKKLGCYLIVKNEEKDINACLSNLTKVCDEILVVDTGSNDKTIDIVKSFNNVDLKYFKWINDFSAARNFAMSNMKSDYIFSIDADELLTDKLIERINKLKLENFNGLNSINMFIELDGNRKYLGGRQIVKNSPNNIWKYKVHEKLYYDESNDLILNYDEYIIHKPHESKSHYNKYAEIYYDEINKGEVLNNDNKSHYFYYLFFTLNNIDNFIAKKYLYNCFDISKIVSNTENQGFNLFESNWIDDDDFYLNTLIGAYKKPHMVLPYYNILKSDTSKLICLKWCYDQNYLLSENQYIDLAYLSYQYGLFNDFVNITKESFEKYPQSVIINNNINFINDTLNNLNEYELVIDCTKGCECLPSVIHFMSQYFNNGFILYNDINEVKKYELLNYTPTNNVISKKKKLFINSNVQYDRYYLKNIMEKLCYNNEPKENNIYIK